MSRAYCLTCNEPVQETAGGTCPLGHPVTAADHGPEPWVGFATSCTTTGFADDERAEHDVPLARVGPDGRPAAHAGVNGHPTSNGHATGAVNGHALGGGHGDHAADDLAALLAEALGEAQDPQHEDTVPEDRAPTEEVEAPADTPSADDFALWDLEDPAPSEDWDDLASLAAELRLDADQGTDDGPAAHAEAPVEPPAPADPTPAAPVPPADPSPAVDDAADLDAMLAELTESAEPQPPAAPEPEAATPPPPPPPPAAPPLPEPVPVSDSIPPLDDLRSPPPTAEEPPGLWDDTDLGSGFDDPEPAPQVDLTNFTARGRRVGGSGASSTPRLRLGRKKKG